MAKTEYGLGRIHSEDARDLNFPMKALLPQKLSTLRYKYWRASTCISDQKATSECTAFSWCNFLTNSPIYHKENVIEPHFLYTEEQKIDPWANEVHDGSTVRAGAQVLQSLGFIGTYNWSFEIESMIQAVLTLSPVVIGINWYSWMFSPDKNGLIKIGGSLAGGHAVIVNGVNRDTGLFRIRNSWGWSYGNHGNVYLSFDDMSRLFSENAECCLALEINKTP